MNATSDPRVFFAAERTLLAWLRTGITIMALGFVVSRFGLFVELVAAQSHRPVSPASTVAASVLGVAFALIGSLAIAFAAVQHRRFIATLPLVDRPASYSRSFAIGLSWVVAAVGIGLAAYMALSPH